jgi:acyl-CoA reductase-like NAD-dependent aldehyde dehydrogenase
MKLADDQISAVVERVVKRLAKDEAPLRKVTAEERVKTVVDRESMGVFETIDDAVAAATVAFNLLDKLPLQKRGELIEAMRKRAMEYAVESAEMAVKETGLGRIDHKIIKNRLAIQKTPGIEILKPEAVTGDFGLTITERAPYGVIGSITPCTNPTATVISNAIGMIAGGNSIVINGHPTAKETTIFNVRELNKAIVSAGGPANLLTTVKVPTIESANRLMKHPGIALLVVTGGPAVVEVAMGSGKKVIAAGPGNPPAVVDETADIPMAAKHIIDGASFDNNIVCIVEKEIIAVEKIADELIKELKKNGAYLLSPYQVRRLEKIVIDRKPERDGDHGMVNKKWVGRDASLILKEIDVNATPDIRLIIAEVPKSHPFVQMELLMPVVGLVRVKDVNTAIDTAKEVEHGFRHTAVMHSRNIENLSRMARVINTSIFVKNGPSTAGLGFNGEGHASFTIASPTGEGLTTARHFTRERRCTLKDSFRIV